MKKQSLTSCKHVSSPFLSSYHTILTTLFPLWIYCFLADLFCFFGVNVKILYFVCFSQRSIYDFIILYVKYGFVSLRSCCLSWSSGLVYRPRQMRKLFHLRGFTGILENLKYWIINLSISVLICKLVLCWDLHKRFKQLL